MAIPYLIKIDNTALPKLKEYKVAPNKLWSDAGRTMSGKLRATFVGIFPKISLSFVHTTAEEMSVIAGLLDNPTFTVSWYDPKTRSVKSGLYYSGDYEMPIFKVAEEMYQPFSVNLIPFDKVT